jgi:hypothetical protein
MRKKSTSKRSREKEEKRMLKKSTHKEIDPEIHKSIIYFLNITDQEALKKLKSVYKERYNKEHENGKIYINTEQCLLDCGYNIESIITNCYIETDKLCIEFTGIFTENICKYDDDEQEDDREIYEEFCIDYDYDKLWEIPISNVVSIDKCTINVFTNLSIDNISGTLKIKRINEKECKLFMLYESSFFYWLLL